MANPEKVAQLVSMGYSESEAEQALDVAGGDVEQAVGFLVLSSSDRAGLTGITTPAPSPAPILPPAAAAAAPKAAAMPQADALPDFYQTEPVGNLKPPPQYSNPPPPAAGNLKPPPPSSQPQPQPPLEDTFDAMKISGMPLQQPAVDFVPGNDIPERGFGNIAVPAMTSFRSTVSDITDLDGMGMKQHRREDDDDGPRVDDKKVMELVEMGYQMDEAEQALQVSANDMGQAIDFLLMDKDIRQAFVGAEVLDSFQIGSGSSSSGGGGGPSPDPSSETDGDAREKANQFLKDEEERERLQREQEEAKRRKEEEILAGHAGKQPKKKPSYTEYKTSVNSGRNVPKMVVTSQGADDIGSRPFCTCVAARNFLGGGMVNSSYLNSIVKEGRKLHEKAGVGTDYNVGKVLMRFGRTPDLQLVSSTVKVGKYEAENLKGEGSLRYLLATIRNEQPTGWEVVVMEVGESSFCICLPPKGSANKFWLLDLVGRPEFRTEGAYARVHVSLLQLEESLEYVMKIQGRKWGVEKQEFKLFVVKKFKR